MDRKASSDDGQPKPVIVHNKELRIGQDDGILVTEEADEDDYEKYLIRRQEAFEKKGQQSWMFQRDAEEHYFGSIVSQNPVTRSSAVGSTLVKREKKEGSTVLQSNESLMKQVSPTANKGNLSSKHIVTNTETRKSILNSSEQSNRRSASFSRDKTLYKNVPLQMSTFMTHND